MARSKAHHFDRLSFDQSIWSKATSHPARIKILYHLQKEGITPFHVLRKKIPLARTTVSQHLSKLVSLGLIHIYEEYPHSFYQVEEKICKEFVRKMKELEKAFEEA